MNTGASAAPSTGTTDHKPVPPPDRLAELDETPDPSGAFPRLDSAQIEILAARGTRRPTERGEVLIVEGEPQAEFFVVLEGTVAIMEDYGTSEQRVIRARGPGRFLGEF